MTERIKMNIEIDATPAQATALEAMFDYWNQLADRGSTKIIGFYVDGDGDFKPNCKVSYKDKYPKILIGYSHQEQIDFCRHNDRGVYYFDYDGVAAVGWRLEEQNGKLSEEQKQSIQDIIEKHKESRFK